MNEATCCEQCPIITTWVNSSLVVWAKTSLTVDGMYLKIGLADGSGCFAPVKARFHPLKRMYRFYVPAKYFPIGCETHYKIEMVDSQGERMVFGLNKLRILVGGFADADDDRLANVGKNCHIRLGDSWYRMTVVNDDDGLILCFFVFIKMAFL